MTLLIVDDSEDIRLYLKSLLKHAGYETLLFAASAREAYHVLGLQSDGQASPAERGSDAVAHESPTPVDLILMDIAMPEEDGIEACRRIKSVERFKHLPIIMVTGMNEEKLLHLAFEYGATDYVTKPISRVELLARLRSALREKAEVDCLEVRERELLKVKAELEALNGKLRRLSSLDGLTGIANRRCFEEELKKEYRRALRDKVPLSLIMIDIDHFKAFNDTFGHQAGDDCLKKVAKTLAGAMQRAGDLAARYGGEEFAVILPETPESGALQVAQRLRKKVAALTLKERKGAALHAVTISLGVGTVIPLIRSLPSSLVALADEALYRAKGAGRNRVEAAQGKKECA